MKQVIMMIRPNKYLETKQALADARFFALTGKDVFGRGKRPVKYLSAENEPVDDQICKGHMTVKKMLEIYVNDEDLQRLIDVILQVNQSGNEGDGKIFVLPCEDCVRIHTSERGTEALI